MINKIKKIYPNDPDLIIKKINEVYTIVYFESICSSDRINEFITKSLLYKNKISAPHVLKIKQDELEKYLNNAFGVIIKNNKELYAAEVRGDLARSIDSPETQPSINGPKDALTENIQLNLGLIKRRIKTKNLKIINNNIGKYTDTLVQTLYIENDNNAEKGNINFYINDKDFNVCVWLLSQNVMINVNEEISYNENIDDDQRVLNDIVKNDLYVFGGKKSLNELSNKEKLWFSFKKFFGFSKDSFTGNDLVKKI